MHMYAQCAVHHRLIMRTYSTSLTLSSSLRVQGLTERYYIWTKHALLLPLTLDKLRGTNPTTQLHISRWVALPAGRGITFTPLRAVALGGTTHHASTYVSSCIHSGPTCAMHHTPMPLSRTHPLQRRLMLLYDLQYPSLKSV